MKHQKTYEALKATGHSPAKAAEIILDATRGQRFALRWCAMIMRIDRREGLVSQ